MNLLLVLAININIVYVVEPNMLVIKGMSLFMGKEICSMETSDLVSLI